jgi:hypothetical protein
MSKKDAFLKPTRFNLPPRLEAAVEHLAQELGVVPGALYFAGAFLVLQQVSSYDQLVDILNAAQRAYLGPDLTNNSTPSKPAPPAAMQQSRQVYLLESTP